MRHTLDFAIGRRRKVHRRFFSARVRSKFQYRTRFYFISLCRNCMYLEKSWKKIAPSNPLSDPRGKSSLSSLSLCSTARRSPDVWMLQFSKLSSFRDERRCHNLGLCRTAAGQFAGTCNTFRSAGGTINDREKVGKRR